MHYKKKVSAFIRAIALVEILAILFSGFTIASYASPLQTLDDPSDKEAAESLALDYIGNFVDNSYLYETNDLHKSTILSLFDDQSDSYAIASYSSVAFPDGTELSLSEMSDQLENFICVADYYRYIRQRQNFQRYDFTFTPQIIKAKFCANHAMRKACILSDYYSGPVRLIVPRYMREATVCIDGSGNEHNAHRFAGANGYPCNVCSYCGYNKLRVSGNLLRPIPVGSTRTLYGTANMSCYRMAIAVRYENGTNSWTESLSCSQITRSYTFTQAGLYTITVCARDLNDSNANSIANTFTYTIRVYS